MSALASRRIWLSVLAAAALGAATVPASAGPFSGLEGAWSGSGQISLENGAKERIRCRANYSVGNGGNTLQQSLRCASDSYNFELRSDVESHDGRISGNWVESTRNVGGTLSGSARHGRIEVSVESPSFNAALTLSSHGNRQSVTIRSSGGQLTGASITLERRG